MTTVSLRLADKSKQGLAGRTAQPAQSPESRRPILGSAINSTGSDWTIPPGRTSAMTISPATLTAGTEFRFTTIRAAGKSLVQQSRGRKRQCRSSHHTHGWSGRSRVAWRSRPVPIFRRPIIAVACCWDSGSAQSRRCSTCGGRFANRQSYHL